MHGLVSIPEGIEAVLISGVWESAVAISVWTIARVEVGVVGLGELCLVKSVVFVMPFCVFVIVGVPVIEVVIMVVLIVVVGISIVSVELFQPPGPSSYEFIEPCVEGIIFSFSSIFEVIFDLLSCISSVGLESISPVIEAALGISNCILKIVSSVCKSGIEVVLSSIPVCGSSGNSGVEVIKSLLPLCFELIEEMLSVVIVM